MHACFALGGCSIRGPYWLSAACFHSRLESVGKIPVHFPKSRKLLHNLQNHTKCRKYISCKCVGIIICCMLGSKHCHRVIAIYRVKKANIYTSYITDLYFTNQFNEVLDVIIRFPCLYPQVKQITGTTSDIFLEYIQRNLPEGVHMSVYQVGVAHTVCQVWTHSILSFWHHPLFMWSHSQTSVYVDLTACAVPFRYFHVIEL